MGAVWMRARAEMRARWRAWVVLAVLVGVFGGAVIALAAGARRTDSAYDRFLEATNAADVWVPNLPFGDIWATFDLEDLAKDPLVAESAMASMYFIQDGPGDDIGIVAPWDDVLYRRLNRAEMIEGRLPALDAPDEVSLPFLLARENGFELGDVVRSTIPGADFEPVEIALTVVGIHASAGDFPPVGNSLNAVVSPAFRERPDDLFSFDAVVVRLVDGAAGMPAFFERLRGSSEDKVVFTIKVPDQTVDVERSIGLQVTALWVSVLIAGIAILLVLGQSIARQSHADASEDPVLRSLGLAGADLVGIGVTRGLLLAAMAALIATAVAIGLSPLAPRGVAAIAEPAPGVAVDLVALGIGLGVIVAAIVAITALTGLRRARKPVLAAGRARPSLAARALAAAGARPAPLAGVRFALEPGRGPGAPPVRTTMIGVATGVIALVAALTFAGSLDHFLATPALYGVTWDESFTADEGGVDDFFADASRPGEEVKAASGVAAAALFSQGVPLQIDDVPTPGLAWQPLKSTMAPPLLEGRLPSGPDEIMVGRETLQRIGKEIGDVVDLRLEGAPAIEATITGVGVVPPMGTLGHFGEGIFLSGQLLEEVGARSPGLRDQLPPLDEIAVIYEPGVDHAALSATLLREVKDLRPGWGTADPADIVSFGRVRSTPNVLAGLLAALALVTLVHGLASAIVRRRSELAILRTLGFVRRQLRATIIWHALALALATLVIGVPLGLALGRWSWQWFATGTGVVPQPVLPESLRLVIPGALAIGVAVALLPARRAARARPAEVFRTA